MAEHPELIESAFVNLLVGQNPNPWAGDLVADAGLRIFAGEANLDKDGSTIVCYLPGGEVGDEEPPTSGNRWAECHIELKTSVKRNAADSLAAHKANAAALQAIILKKTLPEDLTAAVGGFSVWGITARNPIREQTKDYWLTGWKVRLLSCPAAFAD